MDQLNSIARSHLVCPAFAEMECFELQATCNRALLLADFRTNQGSRADACARALEGWPPGSSVDFHSETAESGSAEWVVIRPDEK
jgi:hypothetical protein